MYDRLLKLPEHQSFFLFGARATGKSTLLHERLPEATHIDLLNFKEYSMYLDRPHHLLDELKGHPPERWIVIDEVQRVPALLDAVHKLIFESRLNFALTGSSARKLKRGQANLLAGRALNRRLYPLTHKEIGAEFDLIRYLRWGGLPALQIMSDPERQDYLTAYVENYLKEEIAEEQLVRKLAPFHRFLEVAAQANGKLINFSAIARDVGADTTSIRNYFQILEDTFIGYLIQPFHHSVRKRFRDAPKFYLFDCGIARYLRGEIELVPRPKTYLFGEAFEHFLVLEILHGYSIGKKYGRSCICAPKMMPRSIL